MGLAAILWFIPLAGALDAPRPIVALGGIVGVIWAGFVAIFSRVPSWRTATALVAVANAAAASALIAVVALTQGPPARTVLLSGLAIQVLGFAAVQIRALRGGDDG